MSNEQATRIEMKLDKIYDKVSDHGERLTKLETHQKGFFTILGAAWAVIIAAGSIAAKKFI